MAESAALEMHTEESPNAPNIGQVVAIQRPDYVPEKFYDAKTGVINFEAMSKSYAELEKKNSTPAPEETVDETVTPPVVPSKPADFAAVPGVTQDSMKSFSDEINTKGQLSDESYASLQKAGYSKATVDAYVKGLRSEVDTKEAVQAARVADTQIAQIKGEIGGDAVLKDMQAWAIANLSDKRLAAYNAAVSSPDVEVVRLAVSALHNDYTKANGTPERLFGGRSSTDVLDVFESRAEQTRAVNDPRYGTDPAYRAKVAAKMGRSTV